MHNRKTITYMKHHKRIHQSIIALVVTGFVLATAPAVFSQFVVTSESGYGYGACANAPENITSRYLKGKNLGKVALRWNALEGDCANTLDYYQIQLRKSNNHLIEWWNTTATKKRINMDTLQSNQTYKWRVRAIYTDGTTSDWSLYDQFRTRPNAPTEIEVSNIKSTSAKVTAKNVRRSASLQKYQMILKHDGEVIRARAIQHGLRRPRFTFQLFNLDPSTTYSVQVRAVYSTSLKSPWASTEFTTAVE